MATAASPVAMMFSMVRKRSRFVMDTPLAMPCMPPGVDVHRRAVNTAACCQDLAVGRAGTEEGNVRKSQWRRVGQFDHAISHRDTGLRLRDKDVTCRQGEGESGHARDGESTVAGGWRSRRRRQSDRRQQSQASPRCGPRWRAGSTYRRQSPGQKSLGRAESAVPRSNPRSTLGAMMLGDYCALPSTMYSPDIVTSPVGGDTEVEYDGSRGGDRNRVGSR